MASEGEPLVNLSEARKERDRKREIEKFTYGNLIERNPKAWQNIQSFFGIDDDFPQDHLYFQLTEMEKKVVLLNPGLHMLFLAS